MLGVSAARAQWAELGNICIYIHIYTNFCSYLYDSVYLPYILKTMNSYLKLCINSALLAYSFFFFLSIFVISFPNCGKPAPPTTIHVVTYLKTSPSMQFLLSLAPHSCSQAPAEASPASVGLSAPHARLPSLLLPCTDALLAVLPHPMLTCSHCPC